MKKVIFYIVLAVITLGCIFYGLKKNVGDFGISLHGDNESEKGASRDKFYVNEKFESFSAIEVNGAVMELVIEEGNAFNVESSYNRDYLKPEVSLSNGLLKVIQKSKKRTMNGGSHRCRVVITIPSGNALDSVFIDTNVGDVKVRELETKSIDINVNVGEIDVRRVTFESIECESNVGEITIDPLDGIDDYSITASTDVGEVKVDGRSYKRSYNQKGSGSKKIKVEANVGEISIK